MTVLKFALIVAAGYVTVVAAMYFGQRHLLYFPAREYLTPEQVGLSGVDVLKLRTPDGETLVAWHTPARAGKPTILFLHGNGGAIADRPKRYRFYTDHGFGVLFLEYRGFGGSTGSPTEEGILTDARTAYDHLAAQGLTAHDIVVAGESMGTGVAVILAAQRQMAAVALEAPYSSIADIAAERYWWLPARLLIADGFDAIGAVARIGAPLLAQHGDRDELVPLKFGVKLLAAAREPKEMVVIPGGDHFAIFSEEIWAREIAFFERVAMK